MGVKEDAEALGEDPEVRRKAIEALPPFDPNSYVIIDDVAVRPKGSPPARGNGPTKGDGRPGDKKPSPADKNRAPAGEKAVRDVEKNFSGEEDPDGVCVKCIARGLAKGAAWAAAIGLFVAFLPLELAAAVLTVVVLVSLKGLMDLGDNWGNMSSHQKQEAVAEIVGGAVVGRYAPEPGSLAPKGGWSLAPKGGPGPPPVLETPEGFRMPVPEAEPTGPAAAERPMEMGNERDDFARGPGGARKHESHGTASDKSGAGQRRKAGKQEKFRQSRVNEQQAEQQAREDLEKLKREKGDNVMRMILGNQTEEQWIRQRQLDILEEGGR
jgi:hypothetical protein